MVNFPILVVISLSPPHMQNVVDALVFQLPTRGRHGRDCIVAGLTTTYTIKCLSPLTL